MTTLLNSDKVNALIGHKGDESPLYNLHSHTQFCDGRAPMSEMAAAAHAAGFAVWGFSPHSPLPEGKHPLAKSFPIPSDCNMKWSDVPLYFAEHSSIKERYAGEMNVLRGMEIDYLGYEWGAHLDEFQNLELDYRIGSVHFIPNQEGYLIDCDGGAERFKSHLRNYFRNDLRYVVERYFIQELTMLEEGGFDILAHCDKIAANASAVDPDIEGYDWYRALMHDVIRHAADAEVIMEINTKSIHDRHRFFPSEIWWPAIVETGIPLALSTDAHYPYRVSAGREEALNKFCGLNKNY